MPWIMTNVDALPFKGKKQPRGYISHMGITAASALEKTGKVSIITEEEARRRAPKLFEKAVEVEVRQDAKAPESAEPPVLPEKTPEDEIKALEAMTSKELASWLRAHEEEVSVPKTKPERLALALELVKGSS